MSRSFKHWAKTKEWTVESGIDIKIEKNMGITIVRPFNSVRTQ